MSDIIWGIDNQTTTATNWEPPKRYCRYTGIMCEVATDFGYCKLTACVKRQLSNTFNALDALDALEEEKPVYAAITMTDEEAQLLRSILALEADYGTEGHDGQRAVVEVIFNRVLSPRWPDTVADVIYQRGQFATVKYLRKPYNRPGEHEDDAISAVLRETETVLPSTDYVYFSRGKSNGKAFIKLNHHWFSR